MTKWPSKQISKYSKYMKHIILDEFKIVRGIYFLVKGERLQYIGSTNYIALRICIHKRQGKDFNKVYYIEFPDNLSGLNLTMKQLEQYLISWFNPPLNKTFDYQLSDSNILSEIAQCLKKLKLKEVASLMEINSL